MIDFTLPRGLVDLLSGPADRYRIVRPEVRSVDEALRWLHEQPWPHADVNTDAKRRKAVKRLDYGRHLLATGRIGEGRP